MGRYNRLLNMILEEHKEMLELLRGSEKTLKRLLSSINNMESLEGKGEVLEVTTGLGLNIIRVSKRFKEHEVLEETTIYPILKKLNFTSEVERLVKDHKAIADLLNENKRIIEGYKFKKLNLKELASKTYTLYSKLKEIVESHIRFEETLLSKMK